MSGQLDRRDRRGQRESRVLQVLLGLQVLKDPQVLKDRRVLRVSKVYKVSLDQLVRLVEWDQRDPRGLTLLLLVQLDLLDLQVLLQL